MTVDYGAERSIDDERYWRPTINGDYFGGRTYLSERDALRAARRVAERKSGTTPPAPERGIDPDAPDPEWVAELRDAIR